MTHFLSLLCALAMLAGAVVFAHHGGDAVNFVELGAAAPAATVAPHGAAILPA